MRRRVLAALAAAFLALPGARAARAGAEEAPAEEPAPEPGPDPAPEPAPGEAFGSPHGPADGFGHKATGGGAAAPREVPSSASAIAAAVKGGGVVRIAAGEVEASCDQIQIGGNVTVDGGGATLWFPGTNHNCAGVHFVGDNAILRNLRVRNAGDCIDFGTGHSNPSSNVLVENVTVSGSGDDGFSVSYKCHDVTIRWCLGVGCTRAVFYKYGASNLTIHHTILSHYWIRGPLSSGITATLDFRNNLVEYWSSWGSRCEDGSRGNFVNNVWRQAPWAGAGGSALYFEPAGEAVKWHLTNNDKTQIHAAGNVFVGCSAKGAFSDAPVCEAPAVPTEDANAAMERLLSDADGAGCMPRDGIDKAYLAVQQKWTAHPEDKSVTHGLQVPETERRLRGSKTSGGKKRK